MLSSPSHVLQIQPFFGELLHEANDNHVHATAAAMTTRTRSTKMEARVAARLSNDCFAADWGRG